MFGWLRRLFRVEHEQSWPGADEDYAVELHHMIEDIRAEIEDIRAEDDTSALAASIAVEFELDPLEFDPLEHFLIIEEVIMLRRSMAERIEHARARWESIVEPLRLALLQGDTHAS